MDYKALADAFVSLYGGAREDVRIFEAPGRVNLIGEHTDYNGGYVFPAALELGNAVAVRKRDERLIRLAATTVRDRVTAELDNLDAYRALPWGNYQLGVAYVLQGAGLSLPGCDMLFDSSMPFGGGLSSSASIEVATGLALSAIAGEKVDLVQLALWGQKAENTYCGVNCGIMDQFSSAMGKKGHAILLDCNTLEYRYVPLHMPGCNLVVINTRKPRNLVESKYNERRAQCERALELLRRRHPDLASLCQLTPQGYEDAKECIDDGVIRRRARHAVYENARVLQAVTTLESNDLEGFGRLMNESHISLREDYEVTGVELDTIYDAGVCLGGTLGIRMTGAGFGGCAVAIVRKDATDGFIEAVGEKYTKATGYTADFIISVPGDGAREIIIKN